MAIKYRVFSDENLSNFKKFIALYKHAPSIINDIVDKAYVLFQSILLSTLISVSHFRLKIFNSEKINLGLLYWLLFVGKDAWHRSLLTKVTRTAERQYCHNLLESSFGNT